MDFLAFHTLFRLTVVVVLSTVPTKIFAATDANGYPIKPSDYCHSEQYITCVDTRQAANYDYACEHKYGGIPMYAGKLMQCSREFQRNFWCFTKCGRYNLAGKDPDSSPPPKFCGGNPVEVVTGYKYQLEDDIKANAIGGVSFQRYYYNNTNASWMNNYSKFLEVLNPQKIASTYPISKGNYESPSAACTSGWNEIKSTISESWANGGTASYVNGQCKISKNNVIVQVLPIVPTPWEQVRYIPGAVKLKRENGTSFKFQFYGLYSEFEAAPMDSNGNTLQSFESEEERWVFTLSDGSREIYSNDGKLKKLKATNGVEQTLAYDSVSGLLSSVSDSKGRTISFSYLDGQLASVSTNDGKITSFAYDGNGMITNVTRPDNTHRLYHYEDARFPKALTGITDERNVRYATWAYDDKGRAISSEHYGAAEKTQFSFNADDSTTVTNALGKQTIYRFTYLAGQKLVTKVEGQPTENCVGANQNYTYTPEGWLESKTDWKGFKTFYTYNTKGQETSRTEAYGTPLARTTTTEWDPTLNLKTKVTEFNKETTFTYDTNGRVTGQSVRALNAQ